MHKPCGQPWGEGGSWNVHFTNKAYLVKLSTKEGGGQYVQKMLHMVCAWSLRLIKEIGKKCVKLQEKRYLFFSIFNLSRSPFKEVIRQIICWVSRGTTMVMEVKLPYFHGRGSTTVVAVKKSSIAQKLRIHSEMEEKNFKRIWTIIRLSWAKDSTQNKM